jgi:hypothetical protein
MNGFGSRLEVIVVDIVANRHDQILHVAKDAAAETLVGEAVEAEMHSRMARRFSLRRSTVLFEIRVSQKRGNACRDADRSDISIPQDVFGPCSQELPRQAAKPIETGH